VAEQVARVERAWDRARRDGDDLYLDAAALGLHAIYSGVERLLEQIVRRIDGKAPAGQDWHRSLLQRAAEPTPSRPAAISQETRQLLEPYRGFRHVVRNVYAFRFDALRMEPLVEGLPDLVRHVNSELSAFADLLEASGN
jgi:hypothetical protein